MSASRKLDEFIPTTHPLLAVAPILTGVVVGVFNDKVLGKVLNLNVLGTGGKICSFNCSYCSMGPTTVRLNQIKKDATIPTVAQVIAEVRFHLANAIGAEADFDTICVTGNGEPTLHPEFSEMANALAELRRTAAPHRKLAVRTNASTLDARKIVDALNLFDERIVKFDVGNDRLFKVFNNPLTRKTLTRLIADVRALRDVIIETTFVKGVTDNTQPTDVDDWMEVVAMTQPKRVHLRTIATRAALAGIQACDEDTLYTIASRFERKTQIRAIVTEPA